MSNFKGKRMVSEDLIKKLEDLDPSGGAEYTAGTGIDISAENEISIDTDTVATKDELFSGDYDDLTNKPTNLVTTDTQQNITSQKTFIGSTTAPLEIKGADGSGGTIRFKGENDFVGPRIYGSDTFGLHLQPKTISNFEIEDSSRNHIFKLPSKANGTYTLATSDEIPAAVSGTNDGTNWTSLTVGSDTYAIPAGGSGGSQLYVHNIYISSGNGNRTYSTIITTDNTQFTLSTLASYLYSNGLTLVYPNSTACHQSSGLYYDSANSKLYIVGGIASSDGTSVKISASDAQTGTSGIELVASSIKDYVHAL